MLTNKLFVTRINDQFVERLFKECVEISDKEPVNGVVHRIEENKSVLVPTSPGSPNLLPRRHYAGWESRQDDAV